jgi:hypothetical protein
MIQLYDGKLSFQFRSGETTVDWEADVVELKLTAELVETRHDLSSIDGYLSPTIPFLRDLLGAYQALGCPDIGLSGAKQVWVIVANKFIELSGSLAKGLVDSQAG